MTSGSTSAYLRALSMAAGLELTDEDVLMLQRSLERHRAEMSLLRAADEQAAIQVRSGDPGSS